MLSPNTVSLLAWNANGIKNRIHELREFLKEHSPDILLIQETHLRPEDRLNIANYTTYRSDYTLQNIRMRGTAIIIKNSLPHHPIILPTLSVINATGININLPNLPPYTIISAYVPPQQSAIHISEDLKNLNNINTNTIIFGDFNAKHTLWNNLINNEYGKVIYNFTASSDYDVIAPPTPTHYTAYSSCIIDFALVRGIPHNITITTRCDLSSDHNPVLLTFPTKENPLIIQKNKRIHWKNFENFLNDIPYNHPRISNTDEIDDLLFQITNDISNCLQKSTTYTDRQNYSHFDANLRVLIRNKNRMRKIWQQHRTPTNKTNMNRAQETLRYYLKDQANENWSNYLTNLSHSDNSIWRAANRFKNQKRTIPPLKNNDNTSYIYNDFEKANHIAEHLEKQFTLNDLSDPDTDTLVETTINNFKNTPFNSPTPNILPSEVKSVISKLPKRKSPGDDRINNTVVKHLPKKYIYYITAIINAILKFNYFPKAWKNSLIVPVLKPNKSPHSPDSYRPISLLNTLSKIAEKFIAVEFDRHLENYNILIPYQFGFRKSLSAPHQVYRITELLTNSKINNRHTAAIFLDISKAFDRTWALGVIFKLINYNFPPYLIHLIISYLKDRSFQVKINSVLSHRHNFKAGVQQGSILAPKLFQIFINDFPTYTNTHIGIFADDSAIFSTHDNYKFAIHRLNYHLNLLNHWLVKWKIKINEEKCVAVMFTRKLVYDDTLLFLNNTPIPWSKTVKYLGVTLDKNLCWKKHIENTRNKFRIARRALYPLIARNSKLSIDNKLLLYKSYLRPILTYAAPVWATASDCHIKSISASQNTTLRQITDADWYIRNRNIHKDLKILSLTSFIQKLAQNFFNSIDQEIITDLMNYDPTDAANSKRPRAVLFRTFPTL